MITTHFNRDHIVVIDPGVRTPEIDCYNFLSMCSPLPLTYHLPALFGIESLLGSQTHAILAKRAKAIVILGSNSSVNERHPWQIELEDWLMPVLESRVPTFGICYGHQMLARMFGGEVDFLFPDQRKLSGFRTLSFTETGWWTKVPASGSVTVTHNEVVQITPPEMTVIASSPEVKIDGLAHNSLPIWSLQSHPEATEAFLLHSDIDSRQSQVTLEFGQEFIASFLRFAAFKK